jgi:hypothetical protein
VSRLSANVVITTPVTLQSPISNNRERTPLFWACDSGYLELVNLLQKKDGRHTPSTNYRHQLGSWDAVGPMRLLLSCSRILRFLTQSTIMALASWMTGVLTGGTHPCKDCPALYTEIRNARCATCRRKPQPTTLQARPPQQPRPSQEPRPTRQNRNIEVSIATT